MACKPSACVAVAALGVLGLLAAAQAHAASGVVSVHVDPCFAPNEASVASILSVEINRPVIRVNAEAAHAAQSDPASVTIHITCQTPTVFDVQVKKAGSIGRRSVNLVGVDPRVRARVVALSAAEFFEATPQPQPAAQAVPPPQTPPAPVQAAPRDRLVLAQASARRFLQSRHTTWGAGLGLWFARKPSLAVWGDATAEQGHASRTAGEVLLQSLSVRAGGSWQRRFGNFGVALGVGGVAGLVRAEGEPRDTTTIVGSVSGTWAGALSRADVFYDVANARLQLFADVGQPFVTIRGRNDALDERLWRNPWLHLGFAGGWRF